MTRPPEAVNLRQEVPFGNPGIDGRLRLPQAFRCLPRPSSAPEPSHPPDGLVPTYLERGWRWFYWGLCVALIKEIIAPSTREPRSRASLRVASDSHVSRPPTLEAAGGDPAAPSGTATLLRLLPPCTRRVRPALPGTSPSKTGLTLPALGWSDGRCVQGAGTYSPHDVDVRLLGIPRSRGRVAALDPNYGGV